MISLDDPRLTTLAGGYGIPYDVVPALRLLTADWTDGAAWDELWSELHHQGDVGDASYATVCLLVPMAAAQPERGWNVYALAGTIEAQRHARTSTAPATWLRADYAEAWDALTALALTDLAAADLLLARSALACVALGRGQARLGAYLLYMEEGEVEERLEELHAWSEVYRDDLGPPASLVPNPIR